MFGDGIDWDHHIKEIFDSGAQVYYDGTSKPEKINRIKKYKPSGSVLDCGCHIGRWINVFRENGYEYTGIDQSVQAVEVAKKYQPDGKFIHSFLWDLNFREEFDIVHTNAVLQHNTLEEQEMILPRMHQSLKPDGILVITESTVNEQTRTQRTYEGWISFVEKHGFRFVESWHKNELGLDDNYIFTKRG